MYTVMYTMRDTMIDTMIDTMRGDIVVQLLCFDTLLTDQPCMYTDTFNNSTL